MFKRAQGIKKKGLPIYEGTSEQIAEQIVESCWNTKFNYFQVSAGHFSEFYSRDFGMCAEALVNLGYGQQVIQTLDYALNLFQKAGHIATSISPEQTPFDFPNYAADSLPFIIHALRVAGAQQLVEKYRAFLEQESKYYFTIVFDEKTSLVRKDKHFSSIKDYAKRHSSCYSNCMMSMLSDDLTALGLNNPFLNYNIKQAILSHFWNGRFFYDSWVMDDVVTGDANTFPFWCGVTNDPKLFAAALSSMAQAGLDRPFPLKYTTSPDKIHKMRLLEIFSGDYERDAVWIHLGLCFMDVVKRFDPKRFEIYMKQYEYLINTHKNFLEVYDKDGKPFHNSFYYTDDSMSWVSKWLVHKKQ